MRKHFDKFKRKLICSFYISNRGFNSVIRDIKRNIRQNDIKKQKSIYDLSEMD